MIMRRKNPAITVRQFRCTTTATAYRVLTTANTTVPKIDEVLPESEIQDYIRRGYQVTILGRTWGDSRKILE